jgi:prophage regulatory protein
MTSNAPTPARRLRLPEVIQLTGYRDSNIYHLMALGQFPKNVKLGARSSVLGCLRD